VQGAWLSRDQAANQLEIQNLIAAVHAGEVDVAVVGSETLQRGDLSQDQLISYMNQVRSAVPPSMDVQITTADTYWMLLNNPAVVSASDIFYANIYPFWESKSVRDAVVSLPSLHQTLLRAAQGKSVWYSEVGWPSAGNPRGEAVPSPENAAFYFSNVTDFARASNIPVFYFEAVDEPWKTEASVGPHWGLFHNGRLKPGMGDVFCGQTDDSWRGELIDGPGQPSIELTTVPPLGTTQNLRGRISHLYTTQYKIGVYIKVGGGWWTKPTFANPYISLGFDGSWEADITTGGYDTQASDIAVFVVPLDYALPSSSGSGSLPAELSDQSVVWITVHRE